MNLIKVAVLLSLGVVVGWGSAACQGNLPTQLRPDPPQDQVELSEISEIPPELVIVRGQQIRQWAAAAESSSEYAQPEWAAIQATGAPDTRRCGDYQTAWASASSDSIVWLEVKFALPVYVTAVNIIQSFNPDQVIKAELVDPFDRLVEIYSQAPNQVDQPCPYTLPISVEKTSARYDRVRITLDQSVLGLGWNQIDAVELVGESE